MYYSCKSDDGGGNIFFFINCNISCANKPWYWDHGSYHDNYFIFLSRDASSCLLFGSDGILYLIACDDSCIVGIGDKHRVRRCAEILTKDSCNERATLYRCKILRCNLSPYYFDELLELMHLLFRDFEINQTPPLFFTPHKIECEHRGSMGEARGEIAE